MRATNDLKVGRPPVLLDEIPWYQMDIDNELVCLCEDPRARVIEYEFRKAIYRWKHLRADTLFEPHYNVYMAYESSGIGVQRDEEILRTDDQNNIVSHGLKDVLEDESALELMHDPVFTARPDLDEERMNFCTDLLGDSIPVKLVGHGILYGPIWDWIPFLRGVEPIMIDLYERPEYLHAIVQKYVSAMNAEMDWVEKNLRVEPNPVDLHCTPGVVSGLANEGWKSTWFRGMAQPFGSVSPQMVEEFEVDYIKPLAERCGYTYYGCCEPLDRKTNIIKKINNLRKIGVSPWANVEACAEQIGKDYVFARKPNPANVALATDPEVIRKETEEMVKTCLKYGCPYELVLKDISTVSRNPKNLIVWADTVNEVLDKYYGKE